MKKNIIWKKDKIKMAKCRICENEVIVICICGFCNACIKRHGHDNCEDIIKARKEYKERYG
jgi:hypothetical protein